MSRFGFKLIKTLTNSPLKTTLNNIFIHYYFFLYSFHTFTVFFFPAGPVIQKHAELIITDTQANIMATTTNVLLPSSVTVSKGTSLAK